MSDKFAWNLLRGFLIIIAIVFIGGGLIKPIADLIGIQDHFNNVQAGNMIVRYIGAIIFLFGMLSFSGIFDPFNVVNHIRAKKFGAQKDWNAMFTIGLMATVLIIGGAMFVA